MKYKSIDSCLHCGFTVFAASPNCPRCAAALGKVEAQHLPPASAWEASLLALEAGRSAYLLHASSPHGALARAAEGGFSLAGFMGVVFVAPACLTAGVLGYPIAPVLWSNTACALTAGLAWFALTWALHRDSNPMLGGLYADLARRELVQMQRFKGRPVEMRTACLPLGLFSVWLNEQAPDDDGGSWLHLVIGQTEWPRAWGHQKPHQLDSRWAIEPSSRADQTRVLADDGRRLAKALGIQFLESAPLTSGT